jgi:hypothetical protein
MERINNKVILLRSEITECPLDPAWAAKMVRLYGVDGELKGRLGRFARCPEVLERAALHPIVVESEREYEETIKRLKAEIKE